jgi:hypothetical protein
MQCLECNGEIIERAACSTCWGDLLEAAHRQEERAARAERELAAERGRTLGWMRALARDSFETGGELGWRGCVRTSSPASPARRATMLPDDYSPHEAFEDGVMASMEQCPGSGWPIHPSGLCRTCGREVDTHLVSPRPASRYQIYVARNHDRPAESDDG